MCNIKKKLKLFLLPFMLCIGCVPEEDEDLSVGTKWTVMAYMDGDNDLEPCLAADVAEMKLGMINGSGVNVIVLFDGYGSGNTRLYRITRGREHLLAHWGERNMADAETLKEFIEYCKANYPADKYCLIMSDHGDGPKKKSLGGGGGGSSFTKGLCQDITGSGDFMLTADISGTLEKENSVDLFILDACLMAAVEFAYQFRDDASNAGFKAKFMAASAPETWGLGLYYIDIINTLCRNPNWGGGELSDYVVASQQNYVRTGKIPNNYKSMAQSQSFASIDLSKVSAVKTAFDNLAAELKQETDSKNELETLRGYYSGMPASQPQLLHYFNRFNYSEWSNWPFFDIYNFACAVGDKAQTTDGGSEEGRPFSYSTGEAARAAADAVKAMVRRSFAGSKFKNVSKELNFEPDASGVFFVFPCGDIFNWDNYYWYSNTKFYYDDDNKSSVSETGGCGFAGGGLEWCAQPASGVSWAGLLSEWYGGGGSP